MFSFFGFSDREEEDPYHVDYSKNNKKENDTPSQYSYSEKVSMDGRMSPKEFFQPKYIGFFGKFLFLMIALDFFLGIFINGLSKALPYLIMCISAIIVFLPAIYRNHEKHIKEHYREYIDYLVKPSVFASIIIYIYPYIYTTGEIEDFIHLFGYGFFDFAWAFNMLSYILGMSIYLLNVYMKYKDIHIMARCLICLSLTFLSFLIMIGFTIANIDFFPSFKEMQDFNDLHEIEKALPRAKLPKNLDV